jgi:hypothetical protein
MAEVMAGPTKRVGGRFQAQQRFRRRVDLRHSPSQEVTTVHCPIARRGFNSRLLGKSVWNNGIRRDYGGGTVFELSPSRGKGIARVLYSFGDPQGDLVFPLSTLTLDTRGNLYGTASGGGTYPAGAGGVFKVSRSGNRWKGTVVYEFTGSDGGFPRPA